MRRTLPGLSPVTPIARTRELALDAARYHALACVALSAQDQALLRALATLAEESAVVAASRALRAPRYVVDAPGSGTAPIW